MKKYRVPRSTKSWMLANIILQNDLFNDFKIYCYKHPKIKSQFRAANLFLLQRKLRYCPVEHPVSVNMDSLEDYYFKD